MSAYEHSSQVAELKAKIKPIRFAMFTTIDQHGHLVSRPMTVQDIDPDGHLWFYTATNTDLWQNIAAQPQVNVSFAEPADNVYVSVSGQAERVVDRARIRDLWSPAVQAWYPHGPDDPHVMLVRVISHTAEYWDAGASAMVQMYKIARAALTGSAPDEGEHARLKL
jgi:general stress protein 26